MGKRWSGRTSGANIPNKRVWICGGCTAPHEGKKPTQCRACGRMDFTHFHSKAELKRYGELSLELKVGLISDLELQPRFNLHAGEFVKIGAYVGDFRYKRDGKIVVEDVKGGADTDLSHWKRRHAEAEHGVTIDVVRR